MQTRAILSAAIQLKKEGYDPQPEIMIPLIGIVNEFDEQEKVIRDSGSSALRRRRSRTPLPRRYDDRDPLVQRSRQDQIAATPSTSASGRMTSRR